MQNNTEQNNGNSTDQLGQKPDSPQNSGVQDKNVTQPTDKTASQVTGQAQAQTEGSQQNTTAQQSAAPAGFWKARPILKAESPLPSSACSRIFNALALMPFVPLVLFLVLQTVFSLGAHGLWYYDESINAAIFRDFLDNPTLVLSINGQPFHHLPPLYFAFLWILNLSTSLLPFVQLSLEQVLFAGTAVSALLFLFIGQVLGRFVARVDGRTLLASGIIMLSSMFMVGSLHAGNENILFASAIVLCQIFLFHALARPVAFVSFGLAFFFSALACLTGGLMGLVLPIIAGFFFCLWCAKPMRFFKIDTLVGFGVWFLVVGSWALWVTLAADNMDYPTSLLLGQKILWLLQGQMPVFSIQTLIFPLVVFLPWPLLLLSARWHGVFSKRFFTSLRASQKAEGEGIAFLWFSMLTNIAIFLVFGAKESVYLLPALPAFAIITGRAYLQFTGLQATFSRYLLSLFFFLAGVGITIAGLMLFGVISTPAFISLPAWEIPMLSFFFIGAILLMLLGLTLMVVLKSNRAEGVLLLTGFFMAAFGFVLGSYMLPAFSTVLVPEQNSQVLKKYAAAGYKTLAYNTDAFIYSYHSKQNMTPLQNLQDISAMITMNTPFILNIKATDLSAWTDAPMELKKAGKQWLGTNEHILLAFPALNTEETSTPPAIDEQITPDALMQPERESLPQENTPKLPEQQPEQTPEVQNTGQTTPPTEQPAQSSGQGNMATPQAVPAPAISGQPQQMPIPQEQPVQTPQPLQEQPTQHPQSPSADQENTPAPDDVNQQAPVPMQESTLPEQGAPLSVSLDISQYTVQEMWSGKEKSIGKKSGKF